MSSIDERIAELQQRIAEKQAFKRMYHPNRNMAIWDYVAEGDRSGFDKIDASETAYHNMLRQQEQQEKMLGLQQAQQEKMLGLQQDFNARENELNRQNTLNVANINKENEIENKKDEYIRGRNKAAYALNYAQKALSQDPNNIQLQKESQLAKEDFDFYDRKLGGQGYDNIPVPPQQPQEGLNNNQVNDIVKAIVDKKSYTDDDRTKLQVLSEYVNDPTIKEQINTILSNKGKTKEDKEIERFNQLQAIKNSGKNLSTKQNTEYERLKSKLGK